MTLSFLLISYSFPINNSLVAKRHANVLIQMPMMTYTLMLMIGDKGSPDNIASIDAHPLSEVSVEGVDGLLVDEMPAYFELDVW